MATYTMTPYSISFQPRYARGGERRPIADLDGHGLNLKSLINDMLTTYKGDELVVSSEDDSKSLRVRRLYEFEEHTFVEFGVGNGGVEGVLHQRSGGRVSYAADDHNETRVRGMFIFAKNGHEVYWLSEKAGIVSAYWHVTKLVKRLQRDSVPGATVSMDPVADWAAIKAWSASMSVKEIRFDSPRSGSSTQAMNVNGAQGQMRVIVKAKGMRLNTLLKDTGPDAQAVYGYLSEAPLVKNSGVTPDAIIGQGWAAKVAFTNKAGRQRSFGLDIADSAPTLIYQVGTARGDSDKTVSGVSRAYVPSDDEFETTCSDFLEDISNLMPAETSVAAAIMKNH